MATDNRGTVSPAAIIFDLDGTLIDSGSDIAHAANAAREAVGLPPLATETVVGYVGDGVEMLLRRMLAHGRGGERPGAAVDADRLTAALAAFQAHYALHCLDHTRGYPGVEAMLHACVGRSLSVATNKPRAFSLQILSGLGLERHFARVVGGDDAPARKPDPRHLMACLAGLDVDPAQVAVVGDSPNDVRAAHALGAVAVAVTYGLTSAERLRASGPDLVVARVCDLPAALGLGRRG